MQRLGRTRFVLIGALIALASQAADAGDGAPRVRAVRFRGEPPSPERLLKRGVRLKAPRPKAPRPKAPRPKAPREVELRALLRDLFGAPATTERLVAAVRTIESVPGVGGVKLEQKLIDDGQRVDLTFVYDGLPLRLEGLRFVTGQKAVDRGESWRLFRQLQTGGRRLYLAEGRLFHPFLLELDAQTALNHYLDRGCRDAHVQPELERRGELVTLTLRIIPGPRYGVQSVAIDGATLGTEAMARLREALDTQPGSMASRSALRRDREAIRRAQCLLGYPEAEVSVKQPDRAPTEAEPHPIEVLFEVDPGKRVVVGRVQVIGGEKPRAVLSAIPIKAGRPFCADALSTVRGAIVAKLRDRGFPDAQVRVQIRALGPHPSRPGVWQVAVTLTIETHGEVRVERIWFDGNRTTREDVIRQLLAIEEGDLYRQSAIDASVQGIRRSGLFRKVEVRALRGSGPNRAYLYFTLVERDTIALDVLDQTLTFRNVDLADWPDELEQLEYALRGGGQQLIFYAQPNWQGVRWQHDFVDRYLLAELGINRRTRDFQAIDEQWINARGGFGLKAFENRIALVPFFELETTDSTHPAGSQLPIAEGENVITSALGVDFRMDVNELDDERIPYFGLDAHLRGRLGLAALGDHGWVDYAAQLRGHIPLGTNRRGQHYVLRVRGRIVQIAEDRPGQLLAHQRIFPQARGYESVAIGLDVPDPSGLTVRLGGLHATEGGLELRIPIPLGHRNALAPFVDTATVADAGQPLLDNPHTSAGTALTFSFFDERLEGILFAAWPFVETERPQRLGGSIGGSF